MKTRWRRTKLVDMGFCLDYGLFVCLFVCLCLGLPSGAKAQSRSMAVLTPYVTMVRFYIAPSTQAWIFSYNLSSGCDTVIHLLRKTTNEESWEQVAYNDNTNANTLASNIIYTSPSGGLAREYIALVRSKSYNTGGTASLYVAAGSVVQPHFPATVQVGGYLVNSSRLESGQGEWLQTALRPGGTGWTAVVPFKNATWSGATGTYTWANNLFLVGGAAGGVAGEALPPATVYGYLFGTPCNIPETVNGQNLVSCPTTLGDPNAAEYRTAMVYINDRTSDTDGDGLGGELEATLGTCDSRTFCPYDYLAPAGQQFPTATIDTDEDGIPDGEELLGVQADDPADGQDLVFPKWGADPLHKDLFVEVDFYLLAPPFNRNLLIDVANPNNYDFFTETHGAFAEGSAEVLKNPDGNPGISIHIDAGFDMPADATTGTQVGVLGGDYPSNSGRWVQPQRNWSVLSTYEFLVRFSYLGVHTSVPVNCSDKTTTNIRDELVAAANAMNTGVPLNPLNRILATGRKDAEERPSIEVEAVDANGVAPDTLNVQCSEDGGATWVPCDGGFLGFFPRSNAALRAHYSSSEWVDPIRVGRFHYAVGYEADGGGQTTNRSRALVFGAQTTATSAQSFSHEMGHGLGLVDGGMPNWGAWSDCSPNYPSIMNYGGGFDISDFGFFSADPGEVFSLNSSSVTESMVIPNLIALVLQTNIWNYLGVGANIDWNRSETIDGQTAWQAPLALGGQPDSCGAFSGGQNKDLDTDFPVSGPLDVVRIPAGTSSKIMVVFPLQAGGIYYRLADLGAATESNCTGSELGTAADCLSFDPEIPLVTNLPVGGVSAAWFGGQLFVAYTAADHNQLYIRRFNYVNNAFVSASLRSFGGVYGGEPELNFLYSGGQPELVVAYSRITVGSQYFMMRWNPVTQNWGQVEGLFDQNNALYQGPGSPTMVAWPDPSNTAMPQAQRRTCALLPSGEETHFACYDPVAARWTDLTAAKFPPWGDGRCPGFGIQVLGRCVPRAHGKMELAFLPRRLASGTPFSPATGTGKLLLVYYDRSGTGKFVPAAWLSEDISTAQPPSSSAQPPASSNLWNGRKVRDYFATKWSYLQVSGNLAMYGDSGMVGHVGAASYEGENGMLYIYPHADGTPDQSYTPGNDFEVMSFGLCHSLRTTNHPECPATAYW